QPQPVIQSELHRFLDAVICDGRFLQLLTRDPRFVAERVGFELSPETEAELREKSLERHLTDLYASRYPSLLAPIAIVIIVAAIIIIIAITISRYSSKRESPVNDRSA